MDKLIKHIIYSLYPLIEAYSPKVMQQLMDKFKGEIEDFEIEDMSDDKIETYIKRFDQIKNSPKVKEKDLFNWTLPDLIRLITSSPLKGDEKPIGAPEDIVYTDDELEIYDASNEDRCIALKSHDPSGRQENWCIGRGSFDNHRFNERRGYPSYYYFVDVEKFNNAEGNSGHQDFADSFFVISINNKGKYVYTDRNNSPNYSNDLDWSEIVSKFPILGGRNAKEAVKYLPLSDEENINQKYSRQTAPISAFRKFSFNLKKQYLIARKDSNRLFGDMDIDEFAGKVLPQYKELMDFVSVTPGIISTRTLLRNLESYNNNHVKSIIANIRVGDLNISILQPDILPWEVRKLLVKYKKEAIDNADDIDLFVSKDEKYIFFLKTTNIDSRFTGEIKLKAFSEFDSFENVKITPNTEKYLEGLDLSKYPDAALLSMATKGGLKVEWVKDIIEEIKQDKSENLKYKKVGENEFFANFTDLTAFTIEQGRIKKLDFNSSDIQKAFSEESKKGMIQILSTTSNIPNTVNIGEFKSTIDSLSIEDRKIALSAASSDADYYENPTKEYIAFTDEEGISLISINPEMIISPRLQSQRWDNTGRHDNYSNSTPASTTYEKYYAYLRDTNQYFSDGNILNYILGNGTSHWGSKKAKQFWAANNPPLSPDSAYVIRIIGEEDEVYLINKEDPKVSRKVSSKSGKLVKLNLSINKAIELAGDEITATPGRRGRQTGTTTTNRNAPLPDLVGPTAQSVLEDIGLAWDSFPDKVKRKLHNNAIARSAYGNRGASRRRNMLGYRADIRNYYTVGPNNESAIYIIQIDAAVFANIVIQPGNNHYIVTTDDVIKLSSPSQLRDKLRDLDIITEIKKFIIKEYLHQNNKTMKTTELKKLIKEAIKEITKENLKMHSPDLFRDSDDYRLEPEDMDNPDEDLVIIGSGYLDIKSKFGERPSQTNGEYAEIGQKVVDQLHKGNKEAALNYIYSQINENQPEQAPAEPDQGTETIPYTPTKPGEKKKRRKIGNPDADPNPKAMYEMEKEILDRIAKRYKKMKDD